MGAYIIAEAGVNHNGRLDLARELCLAAKNAGADCVKFQTWQTEKIITRSVAQADYQADNTGRTESQFDMLKRLELSYDDFRAVKAYCDEIGIQFASTADEADSLDFLLTLGIPGDGCVAIMLSALMINGLNPGLSLFTTDGAIMYAIMLGLILVNIFMFLQGKYLTSLFAKVVSIPQQILTPIIVIFCFAGAYSVNSSYFDLSVALVFGVMAWFMRKLELPAVPVLLGMVLGNMTETNFRRALLISDGSPRIFVSSVYCWIFIALIVVVIIGILRGKMKETKNAKVEQ